MGGDWCGQSGCLLEGDYVPNIAEMVWAITSTHFDQRFYVRTNSVFNNGAEDAHVSVGLTFDHKLFINNYFDLGHDKDLGLASARKLL